MHPRVKDNIWKMYLIRGLKWFLIVMPIIVLFYQENGLSLRQVFILQSVFAVIIVLLEIPSGYFSDYFGRKTSIVAGTVLGTVGWLVYALSFGFWGFLLAEIVLGAAAAFISGADSALLYDSLLELNRSEDYKKVEGRFQAVANFSEATAGIVGGLLATISLRFPVYVYVLVVFLTIPLALSLAEPARRAIDTSIGRVKMLFRILKFSMSDNREIKWLILYSAVVSAGGLLMAWLAQPFFREVGLPLVLFGVMWAALNYFVGIFSFFAHGLERRLGRKRALILMIVLTALTFFLLAGFSALWAIAFIFIIYFVRGINVPVTKDYVNRLVSSEFRATVLSVKALAARLTFAVVGPLVGWLSDAYSLQAALYAAGLIFLVMGGLALLRLHKYRLL